MMNYPYVHQLGFVVKDMEKAREEYGRLYHIEAFDRAFGHCYLSHLFSSHLSSLFFGRQEPDQISISFRYLTAEA